ncbi:hypothetical protein PpBr36_02875 [Pyricularia pennisetigena]|uniref:hypothetical protein n=1 Tax=Pyricularia pennisetigena TaxID=1578925 RepID=UPI001153AF41|nr:hypothetical protein PpBr36_02875 [Pyricularia pennisetigena]TLS30900.1 hypothetical protein PpBr36_02875 [Pyricularia pennisetigena]
MPLQLSVKKTEGGKPGKVYYPLELKEVPMPSPGPNQLLIRYHAVALNHRDLFIRQHLYPGISFDAPMLADGYATVVSGPSHLVGKAVLPTPSRGWRADPDGPEELFKFAVCGSAITYEDAGTAREYAVIDADEVELAPEHLSPTEGAALPLVGLTAWRAVVVKAGISPTVNPLEPRRNVLVTGIGGGVALAALQFAVAMNCRVWVTSGTAHKIERAKQLGAEGGVNYRDADWDKQLAQMLPKVRPFLDAIIDGAGGDIVKRSLRVLKAGGIISSYGMTTGPKMDWVMQAVLKHIEIRGTTMGSRKDYRNMIEFVRKQEIKPVVSRVVKGLDNLEGIEGLFDDLKAGKQFGKLVIEIPSQDMNSKASRL